MKRLLKNCSLLNSRFNYVLKHKKVILTFLCFSLFFNLKSQIINYVNNGSFEDVITNTSTPLFYSAKYWGAIDSNKFSGELLSKITTPIKVPNCSYTYQWPRSGNNHLITAPFSTFSSNNRGYPRNRLKNTLISGKTYCVTFYVNLSNQSTHGINAIAAYFGDSSLDTITKCTNPITYLTPQVTNPVNNIITDTLNWTAVTGTFIANGTEKFMLIGNFKSNANTNTSLTNTTNLPSNFSNYLVDDVSVIELNLPAFAGRDTSISPGSPVFLGRQPDVGIDEACVWYKLPSTTPIDTIAGFWVQPTATSSYVVEQTICGLVKRDTVVIHMNLVGNDELKILNDELKVYPVPASDVLNFEIGFYTDRKFKVIIQNSLGQVVREEELEFKVGKANTGTKDLEPGIYFLQLKSETQTGSATTVSKRFIISR